MRLLTLLLFTPYLCLAQSDDYFQQEVNYDITARLDDATHTLHADLRLQYVNNAPTALNSIYFHLWPRAFRSSETAFARQQLRNGSTRFHFADEDRRGDLDSLDFSVNGVAANFTYTEDPDIGILHLNEPLLPGDTLLVTTPFRVKIPASFSRLGHVGQSYQMTQWYPKPAVYDREGWHPMPYLDQGEFYSEFGSFRVELTLPENYLVGATGVLQEEEEREWLLKKADSTATALKQRNDLPMGYVEEAYPPSSSRSKTITYTADRVHDFAWFADKRFGVLHDTLHLRSRPDAIDVWAFFTESEAGLWADAMEYMKRATRFYSERLGDYPYPQVTGVQSALSAGAGMEYPMITVIGLSGSGYALDEVLAHEIGHNWFYGILGSNERDHAWMDEGLNSYYEGRYTKAFYPERDGRIQILPGREIDIDRVGYRYSARLGKDQAPDTGSDSLERFNYFLGAYSKPELALQELEEQVGTEQVDAAFRRYYERWKFRHPQPEDFFAEVDRGDYLRDAMLTTTEGEFNEAALQSPGRGGLSIGLVTDEQRPGTQLFIVPLIGFNANDGLMAGLALHNRTLEPRKFEFLLAPGYGFGSKELVGFGGARYRLTRPLPWLQRVEVSGGVQQFTDFEPASERFDDLDQRYTYRRSAVKAEFVLDHPAVSGRRSSFYSQYVHLRQQRPAFDGGELLDEPAIVTTDFLSVGYRAELEREINPAGYGARLEYRPGGDDDFRDPAYLRLEATLTGGYQYRRDRFVRWRLFGGYFLSHDNRDRTISPATSFSLVDNADSDYRYDDLYLGRNQDGVYQQQLERRQGGFRAPIPAAFAYGRSNDYMGALNLDADLPLPLPIGVFVDAGVYGFRPTVSAGQSAEFNYVAGLSISILQDRFHLYVPLLSDSDTRRLLEERGNLLDRLSVRLDLIGLLPFNWLDDLY